MTWKDARDATLQRWTAVRDGLGTADPVDLLTDANAVVELCEKADELAGDELDRCRYCLFYQQFGGCQKFSAELSELIVEREWERGRALIDDMIRKLLALELPDQTAAA